MASSRGCWTCKDRKVSCDRTYPTCLKCTKSNRQCGGYGIRLTWPKPNKGRASAVARLGSPIKYGDKGNDLFFINVGATDVRLHLALAGSDRGVGNEMAKEQLIIPTNFERAPAYFGSDSAENGDLIGYFNAVIADILPVLHTDRAGIQKFCNEAMQSGTGKSSDALTKSVLALAAYHRGDNPEQIALLREQAIQMMYTDSDMISCQAGQQHVIANLLLCTLEMQLIAESHSSWIGFVCSVKEVLHVFDSIEPCAGSSGSVILGWAYYFDIMTRFSLRHWRTEHVTAYAEMLGFQSNGDSVCHLQFIMAKRSLAKKFPKILDHAHPVLLLLSEVSETLMYSTDARYTSEEYQEYLNGLRARLECVSSIALTAKVSMDSSENTDSVIELVRLAALIYLERISRNFSGRSLAIGTWTEKAISIIKQLDSSFCSSFSLFVVGCEVSADKDRMAILDFFARMEKRPHLPHSLQTKGLIQTAWNHHDLQEDGEVDYIAKLNLVMSTRETIPSFI